MGDVEQLPDMLILSHPAPILSNGYSNSSPTFQNSLPWLPRRLAHPAGLTYTPNMAEKLATERMAGKMPASRTGFTGYTDEFKAAAVDALIEAGYPQTWGSLAKTCADFKVSPSSLITWAALAGWKQARDPSAETELLISMIVTELVSIFAEMERKRERASYSQLSIGMGILFDKLFMLTGNVPEIKVDLVHRIAEAITAPWTSSNAQITDSAEIIDSDVLDDDST